MVYFLWLLLALQVKVGKVASFVGKIFVGSTRCSTTKTTNICPTKITRYIRLRYAQAIFIAYIPIIAALVGTLVGLEPCTQRRLVTHSNVFTEECACTEKELMKDIR